MSQRNNKNHFNPSNAYSGLMLFGTVVDRVRRMVPKNNPVTEIVTYTIQDYQNRKHFVDDYAPDSYYDIGENVELPNYIKPYVRKNGDASYTLNIQKTDNTRGDHF